jgi:hypothetical protein
MDQAGTETSYGSTWTVNDVIGVAVDLDSGKIWFAKNGTWQNSGDPAAGTNAAFTTVLSAITNPVKPFLGVNVAGDVLVINFGQRPFAYTPPTGFKALNTQNLPEPTIKKGNQYFDAKAYTGNGGTQTISGMQFAPDLVWIKNRGSVTDHGLFDTVRGATKRISSNLANAESTEVNSLTAFTSDGFTVGATQDFNQNGVGLVGWQWKEGATPGFDIVTYTGDGTSPRNISHSLGAVPAMVIVKSRGAVSSWIVKHKSLSSNNVLFLEATNAQLSPSNGYVQDLSSSSTFGVVNGGGGVANVNTNGTAYVAYLFAEVAGFSKAFSYTGNGSTDGPFVFCGFRPRWVMIKRSDGVGEWGLLDTAMNTYNVAINSLQANTSDAQISNSDRAMDFLSNGFKIRNGTTFNVFNVNGGTYVGIAFAEVPYKFALGR